MRIRDDGGAGGTRGRLAGPTAMMLVDGFVDGTDDDDDSQPEISAMPALQWEDDALKDHLLESLNRMRKNQHFCDVTLQIGKTAFPAHRAVLAAASPYLFELFTAEKDRPTEKEERQDGSRLIYELNGGFCRQALERLIEYAYTARLSIPGGEVLRVYAAATRLRMDRAAAECVRFMAQHLDIGSCLDIRALRGISRQAALVAPVDDFIAEQMSLLRENKKLRTLPRADVEVLHHSQESRAAAIARPLCELVLDWIHQQWLEDENFTVENFTGKHHYLYVSGDNTLQDCGIIEEGSAHDSEIIQDYKKNNQYNNEKNKRKVARHTSALMKPAKPRELLYSRHINQDDSNHEHTDSNERGGEDWKVIGCLEMDDKSAVLAVVTIAGRLVTTSIIQRINRPPSPQQSVPWSAVNGSTAQANGIVAPVSSSVAASTAAIGESTSPLHAVSRPPSIEKDLFEAVPLSVMSQAKCGVGVAHLDGQLIVCGGYDRGECLNKVESYDPKSNTWTSLRPMLTKRGRFDVSAMSSSDAASRIYAVGGSNGQTELSSVERFDADTGKWTNVTALPHALSNVGVCNLSGKIYCIGGLNGQTGSKYCFSYDEASGRWERIASLHKGRSQAAVTAFHGKLWVVGGCDAWNPINSVEIYDPATNAWKFGPPLSSSRRGCGLAVRAGSELVVAGGSDGTQSLCTTEVLDAAENVWRPGTNMTTCRTNVSLANVSGKIFAVGGFSGKVFLNTIEYLDPSFDEWTTFVTLKETPAAERAEAAQPRIDEEAAPAETEAAPPEMEAAPPETEAAPAETEAAPAKPEVTPAEAEAAPQPSHVVAAERNGQSEAGAGGEIALDQSNAGKSVAFAGDNQSVIDTEVTELIEVIEECQAKQTCGN